MIVSTMKAAFCGLGDPTPTTPAEDPSAPATDPGGAANAASDAANAAAAAVGLPSGLNWKTILGGAAVGWWVWGIKGAVLGAGAGWYVGRDGAAAPALPSLPGGSGTTVASDGSTVAAPSGTDPSAGGDSMSAPDSSGGVVGPTGTSNPFGPTDTQDASSGATSSPDMSGAVPIDFKRGRSSGQTFLAPPKNSVVITPAMMQKRVVVASSQTSLAASTRPTLVPSGKPSLHLKGYGADHTLQAPVFDMSRIKWGTVLSGIFAGAFVAGKPGAIMGGVAALAPSLLGSLE